MMLDEIFLFLLKQKLRQLGVDSVVVFLGHSLCRWQPPYHKYQGGCLADIAKVLAVAALCKANLSSIKLYLHKNIIKPIQHEYPLRFYINFTGPLYTASGQTTHTNHNLKSPGLPSDAQQ
jgi:hypothetical protein